MPSAFLFQNAFPFITSFDTTSWGDAVDVAIPILRMEKLRPGQAKLFPRICMVFNWNSRNLNLDLLTHVPVLPLQYPASSQKKARDIAFLGASSDAGAQRAQGTLRRWVSGSVNHQKLGSRGNPSLTSFWPSVRRCTARSLASRTSCIWELRARPRASL